MKYKTRIVVSIIAASTLVITLFLFVDFAAEEWSGNDESHRLDTRFGALQGHIEVSSANNYNLVMFSRKTNNNIRSLLAYWSHAGLFILI
jgi:hypothetical protein